MLKYDFFRVVDPLPWKLLSTYLQEKWQKSMNIVCLLGFFFVFFFLFFSFFK